MAIKVLILSFVVFLFIGCRGNTPRTITKVQGKVEVVNPYNIKQSEKLKALTDYFIRLELEVQKPILPRKPDKPLLPKVKNLTKGKYEKAQVFQKRVANAELKRDKKIEAIESQYSKDMKVYNSKVKKIRDKYNNSQTKKQKNIDAVTISSMQKAYSVVYGKPYLDKSLKYDAENESFYGNVKSTKGGFSEQVAIKVPSSKAESFERNLDSLKTEVVFDYDDGRVALKKIVLKKGKKSYLAVLSDMNFKSENITPFAVTSADPEVAKLQKQKFDLEKKKQEKKRSVKREAELNKQRKALETEIALLQQSSGGVDDIGTLLKNVKAHRTDKKKWLFIIAIENYEYTDSVAYSANSAKQFKKVMKKRLGIPEKNVRTLINRGATSGKIRYRLKDMLAHVKKGDTIYFYYSGHGIPVPAQKNAPYLLAQDMSPEYVADDERFKLQNIYKSLSNSKASKVIVFIDSCFSGGADNVALIKGVAATRIKPKKVTFDKNKMIVISAGSGTQYSNKYDDKSNRLFSYYLMRGLIKNNSNTSRLYDYVKSNVQEKSYEMGASYEQVPVYDGNIGLGL